MDPVSKISSKMLSGYLENIPKLISILRKSRLDYTKQKNKNLICKMQFMISGMFWVLNMTPLIMGMEVNDTVKNVKYDLGWEIEQLEDAIEYYESTLEENPQKYKPVQETINKLYQRLVNLKYKYLSV